MPTKAPIVKAPIAVAEYNWTGCYVGANVGGAWGRSNIDIPLYPANVNANATSIIGGAQAGCNYMFPSRWVVGIEGDWDWTSLNGSTATTSIAVPGETFFTKFNSVGTLRGRAGYAWDRTLLYVTGGGAWAHLNAANYVPTCVPGCASDKSATYSGWTAGAGVEYALTMNWIIGAEYLYMSFGRQNFFYNGPTNVKEQINVARARVSYKFP